MDIGHKYIQYLKYVQGRKPDDIMSRELGERLDQLGPGCVEIFNARKGQIEQWAKEAPTDYDPKLGYFIEGMLLGMYLANRKGIIQ